MTGKNPKTDLLIFLPSTLLRLTKKVGETFNLLPFKDENSILGWLTLTPIIPEQIQCPIFFCHVWISRGELYSIPKFEQNARG